MILQSKNLSLFNSGLNDKVFKACYSVIVNKKQTDAYSNPLKTYKYSMDGKRAKPVRGLGILNCVWWRDVAQGAPWARFSLKGASMEAGKVGLMQRAVRFDNKDIQKEIDSVDITRAHAVHFLKKYNNRSVTENGAVGYKTTTNPLLDLNFKVSSLRCRTEEYIICEFIKAFMQDRVHAVKWLFFLRDIWEGLGERRSFRICLKYLAVSQPQIALAVMKLVPEYGRCDDLLVYLDTPLRKKVCAFIKAQLQMDISAMEDGKGISLLAKWLPSVNTSSKESREYAAVLAKGMGYSSKEYRKLLSGLRAYGNVLETKLSAGAWEKVDYEAVPAKANLLYGNAFYKHDKERRAEYLKRVLLGEGKLNTTGLMPYEIVHRLMKTYFVNYSSTLKEDVLAELTWEKITKEGFQNDWGLDGCIVVADGSGSMCSYVSGSSSVRALEVCNSLTIYFAEQLQGVFHNKAITFSMTPKFIDLEKGRTLKDKLEIMLAHNEVANTNIKAVFDMLLTMAVSNQVPQEELPKQVLVLSDMEFDCATGGNYDWKTGKWLGGPMNEALFEQIAEEYKAAGYTMPRLIFWNLCGRTDTIPMVDSESGLCLLSGFSQNAAKVAAKKEVKDPYQCLLQVLDAPRYDKVEEALRGVA